MLIGANLILNDTTLPMREVAPLVEEYGLDALFLGEHTHTPVATVHPQYPGGTAGVLQALPRPLRPTGGGRRP